MNKLTKPRIVKKPWGREIWFVLTGNYLGKILEINPNKQLSLHKHEIKQETMYVYQGFMEAWLEDESGKINIEVLHPGAVLHVEPSRQHSMKCLSLKKVVLFEVSTPFPEDSIRVRDFCGHEETK